MAFLVHQTAKRKKIEKVKKTDRWREEIRLMNDSRTQEAVVTTPGLIGANYSSLF